MFGWLRSKASRHRALNRLDLASVKASLVAKSGWTEAKASDVESAYREFLGLMIDWPGERHVPTQDVDLFWHWHVLDSAKYESDCKAVFGKVLHHDPHFRRGTPEHTAAFERTRDRLAPVSGTATRPRAKTVRGNDASAGSTPASCGADPMLLAAVIIDGDSRSEAPAPSPSYQAEAPDPGPSHDAGSYGGSSYGGSDSGSSDSGGSSCGGASCGGGGD